MENANSYEYLEKIKIQVLENLKRTTFAPSVQMMDVPPDPPGMDDEADAILDDLDEDENKDKRHTKRRWDKYVEKEGELSESEDEEENEENGVRRQPNVRKRRNLMDYPNPNAAVYENDSGVASPEVIASQVGDMANATAEGNSTIFEAKKSGSTSPPAANESADSSTGSPSDSLPGHAAVEEQDVEMGDEPTGSAAVPSEPLVNGAQEKTPPESPDVASATAAASTTFTPDVANDAIEEVGSVEDSEMKEPQNPHEHLEDKPDSEKTQQSGGPP